ncbi:MAG TPA: threonine transporter RhtB [Bosea sp. (in: a-proteobacteria)]|jgi:threonine/homoserine/homoserine lactone efflux protein|uniref:threonine transporter RhtB n=1 Tax=Bosea sp. (in: a-proteobacteria) TaxID=1871050 RepID=UPI002E1464AF|nr:threonine transporter RhtB [Bosea sp. (in: a-proteobacteria)]
MVSSGFILGLALLLATPGPTNTLLALAGATSRPRAAPMLLLAELTTYLGTVVALGALATLIGARIEGLRPWLQAAAALYLLWVAGKMWRWRPDLSGAGQVRPYHVATTTLLNPKTLIIAFVLMPQGWSGDAAIAAAHLLAMSVLIPVAGTAWFGGGRALAVVAGTGRRLLLPRVSALLLGLFAMLLAGRALAGW